MYPYIPLVLSKLESSKKDLYQFLKFVLDLRESGSQPNSPLKTSSRWKEEDVLSASETYESFVELMAEFEPKQVAAYLRSKVSRFRNAKVLATCRKFGKFGLVDAQVKISSNFHFGRNVLGQVFVLVLLIKFHPKIVDKCLHYNSW
jgi:hypothetical protein